jgi:hypothetical protein
MKLIPARVTPLEIASTQQIDQHAFEHGDAPGVFA